MGSKPKIPDPVPPPAPPPAPAPKAQKVKTAATKRDGASAQKKRGTSSLTVRRSSAVNINY
jgi:hypothetical protein